MQKVSTVSLSHVHLWYTFQELLISNCSFEMGESEIDLVPNASKPNRWSRWASGKNFVATDRHWNYGCLEGRCQHPK